MSGIQSSAPRDQTVAELEAELKGWKLRWAQARLELLVERRASEARTIVVVPRRRWGVRQHHFGRDRAEAR